MQVSFYAHRQELVGVNRRLAGLPLPLRAYLSGRLSTSKVELPARSLVRGDRSDTLDDEEAIALSVRLTVRELRRRLGGYEGSDPRANSHSNNH